MSHRRAAATIGADGPARRRFGIDTTSSGAKPSGAQSSGAQSSGARSSGAAAWLVALARTSHPGPSVAITAMIVALAATAQPRGDHLMLFTAAALLGEFSIGWSNDAFDAARDAAIARTDKPIAAGAIGKPAVLGAAIAALLASAPLAFAVSAAAGVIHLVMMAAGWAYNAGLKSTVASAVTYAAGFGLIPAFAASTLPSQPLPQPWIVAAAALLGLGGHFANVLPDLATDRVVGVGGLPQRIAAGPGGPVAIRLAALGLLVGASAVIVLGPGRPYEWLSLAGLGLTAGLALTGALAPGRWPFRAAIAIGALNVILFVAGPARLV